MKVAEIRKVAQNLGVKAGRMNKTELIRSIQKKEGNCECFGSNIAKCSEQECCWRDDCLVD